MTFPSVMFTPLVPPRRVTPLLLALVFMGSAGDGPIGGAGPKPSRTGILVIAVRYAVPMDRQFFFEVLFFALKNLGIIL